MDASPRTTVTALAGARYWAAATAMSSRGNFQGALELLADEQELESAPPAAFFGRLASVFEQRADQLEKSIDDATAEFLAEVVVFDEVALGVRVVLDRHHFFLAQADAADVLIPFDEFLNDGR